MQFSETYNFTKEIGIEDGTLHTKTINPCSQMTSLVLCVTLIWRNIRGERTVYIAKSVIFSLIFGSIRGYSAKCRTEMWINERNLCIDILFRGSFDSQHLKLGMLFVAKLKEMSCSFPFLFFSSSIRVVRRVNNSKINICQCYISENVTNVALIRINATFQLDLNPMATMFC